MRLDGRLTRRSYSVIAPKSTHIDVFAWPPRRRRAIRGHLRLEVEASPPADRLAPLLLSGRQRRERLAGFGCPGLPRCAVSRTPATGCSDSRRSRPAQSCGPTSPATSSRSSTTPSPADDAEVALQRLRPERRPAGDGCSPARAVTTQWPPASSTSAGRQLGACRAGSRARTVLAERSLVLAECGHAHEAEPVAAEAATLADDLSFDG